MCVFVVHVYLQLSVTCQVKYGLEVGGRQYGVVVIITKYTLCQTKQTEQCRERERERSLIICNHQS